MVLPKLQEMSPTLIDAARDLGRKQLGCVIESDSSLYHTGDFCRIFHGIDLFAWMILLLPSLLREMAFLRYPLKFIRVARQRDIVED